MSKKNKKYSLKQIEKMKEEIYENILGALIDDGMEDDDADSIARDEVNEMTDKQIVKEFEEMTQ